MNTRQMKKQTKLVAEYKQVMENDCYSLDRDPLNNEIGTPYMDANYDYEMDQLENHILPRKTSIMVNLMRGNMKISSETMAQARQRINQHLNRKAFEVMLPEDNLNDSDALPF